MNMHPNKRDALPNFIARKMDMRGPRSEAEMTEEGIKAEQALIGILQAIPGIRIRKATEIEDSGRIDSYGKKDLAIDAVGYLDSKPAIGFQITIANNIRVRDEKIEDLKARPFLRLPEMKTQDHPIPRVLIFVNHDEIHKFLLDKSLKDHPKIEKQIRESVLVSLGFVFTKTINKQEQEIIQKLLTVFAMKS